MAKPAWRVSVLPSVISGADSTTKMQTPHKLLTKATNRMSFHLTLRNAETSLWSRSHATRLALFCVFSMAYGSLATPAGGVPNGPSGTKISRQLTRQLKRRANVQWTGAPLRKALVQLGTVFDLPLFIDRRVDSEWTVTLSLEKTPLEEVFRQAAQQHSLGVARVGPVVYVGPASAADHLPRLLESHRLLLTNAQPAVRRRFQKRKSLDWPRRTEPRQLIADAAKSRSLTLENPEAIPHDLWPVGSLPAMRGEDQLTLLLIGFDRTWKLGQGSNWRVVPIEK